MSHPLKISDYEKINRYPPELTVSYPPPYNYLYVTMCSPKYLEKTEKENYYKYDKIIVGRTTQIIDIKTVFESIKVMVEITTNEYYELLLKKETYEDKSITAGKRGDTLIFIPTKEMMMP